LYYVVTQDEKDEKKERVLHTRIPESLEEDLKAHARSLGISVSNLVRNVLSNTLEMVDDIVADSRDVADSVRPGAGAKRRSRSRSPEIVGWQPLMLSVNALCDACNDILPKGAGAHLAVWDGDGPRTIRCKPCVSRIGDTQ
jgi:hypothetical protein